MTEPSIPAEGTQETPAPEASETRSGRGRPRPAETMNRDLQVFNALDQPKTRGQIVADTGLQDSHAYLALFRLRRDGRVERVREGAAHRWRRVEGAQPPEPKTAETPVEVAPESAAV